LKYVIDACAAAALVLPDEESELVEKVLAALSEDDLILVPLLWYYEMANILAGALRRGRLREADAVAAWNLAAGLGPAVDARYGPLFGVDIMDTALSHDLSAYDAAYLELAMRESAVLLTSDRVLARAAEKAGVRLAR
jgi:predicted nucleic acid-binding protein